MMLSVFGPILWLAVALGLLVTFHEFGHFWVARRAGVQVLQFSIGFGPALWSRRSRRGTEYRIAVIPLGGYVRMLDEHDGPIDPAMRDMAFNRKPLGWRAAVVAAGPVFNLIFALAAFWLMFMIGVAESRPVVGEPAGIAATAGVQEKDMVLAVNGAPTQTWTRTLLALMPHALDRKPVDVVVEDESGRRRTLTLDLQHLPARFDESAVLDEIGLQPWTPDLPPVVGDVADGTPAAGAGLQAGDRITRIGGQAVNGWRDIARLIPELGTDDRGQVQPLTLLVSRSGQQFEKTLTPVMRDGRVVAGIQSQPPDNALQSELERAFTILRYGPLEATGQAFVETGRLTSATFGILGRMLTGKASLKNLSGPITIAQMAQTSARLGLSRFLFFLGLISLSLAIINLLPIPVLDGGHLMYYLVEWIKGSPVSESSRIAGQYIGIVLVAGLMGLAIFNDLLRIFS
ncbi:MAG TPA: RIP metalloprotease RseP [Wenzhouxiangella sp.]|nr:RIP metalloprotease RseP [Wenzhouxiangella sp.]